MPMRDNLSYFRAANDVYASDFPHGDLPQPPRRRAAVLTCMDARMDPDQILGLKIGDCHVIRNAGGRASDDAVRSLVISMKFLGVREIYVIHHTNCGMGALTDDDLRALLRKSIGPAERDAAGGWRNTSELPGSTAGDGINWLTFENERRSAIEDVTKLREHPLIPKTTPIYGFVYHVETGGLEDIPEAMEIGAPR